MHAHLGALSCYTAGAELREDLEPPRAEVTDPHAHSSLPFPGEAFCGRCQTWGSTVRRVPQGLLRAAVRGAPGATASLCFGKPRQEGSER